MVAHGTTPLERTRSGLVAARAAQRAHRELPPAQMRQLYTALPELQKELVAENVRRVADLTKKTEGRLNWEFERMEVLRNQLLAGTADILVIAVQNFGSAANVDYYGGLLFSEG